MGQAPLSSIGTSPHAVALTFIGSNITVYYDGVLVVSVQDDSFDGVAPFMRGGICADFYQYPAGPVISVDNVTVQATSAAPIILSATPSSGNMVITWSTIPGHTYRQQFNDNLGTTNWNNITPDVVANGFSASGTNAMSGPGRRFYRVVDLQ